MNRIINYTFSVIAIITGCVIFGYGSHLILDTYQTRSMYIEAIKIGEIPIGEHALWLEERGFKEGLIHIVFLLSGFSSLILGGSLVIKSLKKN